MKATNSPKCGKSEARNGIYEKTWSANNFFKALVPEKRPIILDVGAHHGESAYFFKNIFPASFLYSFEPCSENFIILKAQHEKLKKKFRKGALFAVPYAVAEKTETRLFYKQTLSHLGGLRAINKKSKDSLGYAKKALNFAIQTQAISLDDFCAKKKINKIGLLKVDCQGHEVGVLQGARRILRETSCVSVEVSFYDFYLGRTSLLEVEQIMQNAGLRLWDISKVSKNPKNLRTDWAEFIYTKNR